MWLDYIKITGGDYSGIMIVVQDAKNKSVEKRILSECTEAKDDGGKIYEFNQDGSGAIIRFDKVDKYLIEVVSKQNRFFDLKLYYK